MRSRDFAVHVLNRVENTGVCLFCEEYERSHGRLMTSDGRPQHRPDCPVAEYLRTEHARRNDKTQREHARKEGP